jgi:hypothetical protein
MTKTKKSRADIQRAYRERQKEQNHEVALEKERQRWLRRRSQKRVKGIEDMSNREQRCIRKKWRETKAEYRRREKIMNQSAPPQSIADNGENRRHSPCFRQRARRKIAQLTADADAQRRSKEKYKRRWLRLKLTSGAYLRTQQSCVSSLNEHDASVMNESHTVSISA